MTAYLPPPAPIPWVRPDTRPYSGTSAEAMRLLIGAGFPAGIVRAQFDRLARGECRGGTIRQGDEFSVMLFGRDGIERRVVAETDRWAPPTNRAAVVCGAERAGFRYELWIPAACGNYSERVLPLGSPPWGEAFAPSAVIEGIAGPLYGGSGGVFGAGAFAAAEFGGWAGSGYGAFAGGIGGAVVRPAREVSFALPAPRPIERTAFEVEHHQSERTFRRAWERHWFRRVSVPPIPPVPSPPNTPATPSVPVPEPSSAALLLTALGLGALIRIRRTA